jgi:putative endonuclease
VIELENQPPELKKRVLSSKQLQLPNTRRGYLGEQAALQHLVSRKFTILETNLTFNTHEVDIIARTANGLVCFIEVKTRSSTHYGHASLAVTRKKMRSMQLVAKHYLRTHRLALEYRFDIMCVTPQGIEHIENITWLAR